MVYILRFFSSSKCSLFHNSNYLVPVLFKFYIQGVLKLKKNNSAAKRLKTVGTDLFYAGVQAQVSRWLIPKCQSTNRWRTGTYRLVYVKISINIFSFFSENPVQFVIKTNAISNKGCASMPKHVVGGHSQLLLCPKA
jgi:hypothetical protein